MIFSDKFHKNFKNPVLVIVLLILLFFVPFIFKPELLNRFDGVILFHPLSTENLQKIAALMLKKLQKRLAEKGIELVINDALLGAVMSAGTDPKFGARPMNRTIQEKVEQVIAQKIISGEAKAGSRVELTAAELA